MTTKQTLQALKAAGKTVCLGRLYVYLNRLGIQPIGARQRPQQYPADTAERIQRHLGLAETAEQKEARIATKFGIKYKGSAAGILTLKQRGHKTR